MNLIFAPSVDVVDVVVIPTIPATLLDDDTICCLSDQHIILRHKSDRSISLNSPLQTQFHLTIAFH